MFNVKFNRYQVMETIGVFNGVFLLGILMAILGPTFLDLSEQVGVSSGVLTTLFTVKAAGFIVGCFVGGLMFDRFSRRLVLFGALLGCSVSFFVIPFCSTYVELLVSVTILGLFGGAIDAAVNSRILDIWKEDTASFMQALHFVYSAGCLLTPLIAEPFLSRSPSSDSNSTSLVYAINLTDTVLPEDHQESLIVVPYSIGGALFLANAAYVLLLTIFTKDTFKSQGVESFKCHFNTTPKFIVFMVTTIVFILLLAGNELCFGQLLAAFAVEGSFSISKSGGSFLTALYWGFYSSARLIAIFVAAKVQPLHMLVVDCVGLLIGCLVLVLSLHLSMVELLWVGSALVGFSIASAFPSNVLWTEKYVSITGKVASVFVTGTALGEMLVPLATGQLMETGYKDALVYVFFSNAAINCFVLMVLWFMVRYWTTNKDSSQEDTKKDSKSKNEIIS